MLTKNKKKYVLAVSGGPDSMYMLNKYSKRNIIVAHVNYHYRGDDSNLEQKLVEDYCKLHNIKYRILGVDNKVIDVYKKITNKQSRSRKIRYDFFYQIAEENNIKNILIAHNKDDFLETAIMQQNRDKTKSKLFYGIKKKTLIKNGKFILVRPILNLWKDDITKKNLKKKVPFLVDKSNDSIEYRRNLIRKLIATYPLDKKEEMYRSFISINKFNKDKIKIVESNYIDWSNEEYSIAFFNQFSDDIKKQLIYTFIYQNDDYIKLSSGKINNIIAFIASNNYNKEFKIRDDILISKKNQHLKLIYSQRGI